MKAVEKMLSFIGANTIYEIPFFQRPYVWDEENWEELFDNLVTPSSKNIPYLGSIILKNTDRKHGTTPIQLVIDGQQRLTTLSILLRAFYDFMDSKQEVKESYNNKSWEKKVKDIVDKLLLIEDTAQNQKNNEYFEIPKLRHSHFDIEPYERVINGYYKNNYGFIIDKVSKGKQKTEGDHKLLRCYKYFRERFEAIIEDKTTWSIERIQEIWAKLTHEPAEGADDDNYIVLIILDKSENEQKIFDTVNNSGVRLSSADVIKNTLFRYYLDKSDDKATLDLYSETWEKCFQFDEDTIHWWNAEKSIGQIKRANIELLLYSYAMIHEFFDPDKDRISDLANKFENYIKDFTSTQIKELITDITNYANSYKTTFMLDEEKSYTFSDFKSRLLFICNYADVNSFNPYILHLIHSYKGDELKTKIEDLERFIIIQIICDSPTKNNTKICYRLIHENTTIQTEIDNRTKKSDDSDTSSRKATISQPLFESGLRSLKSSNEEALAKALLFYIELYRHIGTDVESLQFNFTLEHIMPKKWKKAWSQYPVYDTNNQEIAEASRKESVRNEIIYQIGNMTLLTGSKNTSLSNKDFKTKVEGSGDNPGMRGTTSIKIIQDDIINNTDVVNDDVGSYRWDERFIRIRTANLIEEIKKIWNISF